MKTITAESLIYTNVEVEHSPTKQRGFQVWKTSIGLTPTQVKEITRRVDDYVLPIGTSPEVAAEFYVRDAFFPMACGSFAVARTTPLREPDKFKRGGRFFAHVFVVTKDDFEATGSDPFALHAAAKFLRYPSQIEEPLSGAMHVVELTVEASHDVVPATPTLMSAIVGHLDRDAAKRKTIVLIGKPAEIVGKLRPIYRTLPPQLRGAYAFDSFSAGGGLTHSPCAFVGCASAETLRVWAFRRFVKLDIDSGTFTPAADAPLRPLFAKLMASPKWTTADDAGRAAAWTAVELLEQKSYRNLAELFEANPEAEAMLADLSEFSAALETAKPAKYQSLPTVLASDPHVRRVLDDTLNVPTRALLLALEAPLPHRAIADAFAMSMEEGRRLSEDELTAVEMWHAGGEKSPLLHAMTERLRYVGLTLVTNYLHAEAAEPRLAEWLRRNFDDAGVSPESLLQRFAPAAKPTPRDFYDLQLYQAIYDCSETAERMQFRMAYHDGAGAVEAYVKAGHKPPREDVAAFLRPQLILGWQPLQTIEFTYFIGGYFYAVGDADMAILERMQETMGLRPGRPMLREFVPELQAKSFSKHPTATILSPAADTFFRKVLTMKPGQNRDAEIHALRQSLAQAPAEFFHELVDHLRGKLIADDFIEPPDDSRQDAYLFGHQLRWILPSDSKSNMPMLLEIILGSFAAELNRRERPASVPAPNFERMHHVLRLLG